MARILIFDGYPAASSASTRAAGGETAPEIFSRVLSAARPKNLAALDYVSIAVAEGENLPQGLALTDFDGVAITGSPLSAYVDEPMVRRQIELAREIYAAGIPTWGSCWGLQVMCAALGGEVRANPKGYEIGIARSIALTDAGRSHPIFEPSGGQSKGPAFEAISIHHDEVCRLPTGATLLATNAMSEIQAVAIDDDTGRSFWGVQYHPEFDLAHIALLLEKVAPRIVAEGKARSAEEVESIALDFAHLAADPNRKDIAWRHGIGAAVLDCSQRTAELTSWLTHRVAPALEKRSTAA